MVREESNDHYAYPNMFLIVHNPLSNNKKSKKTTNKWVRFFKFHKVPFTVRSTLKINDLNQYLEDHPNITDILYLGGDGSINYLINNVNLSKIKAKIHLAKSGSGNDFLRTLKQKGPSVIQVGKAVTDGGTASFINGCGVGFDALVGHYVNNDKKKSKISYFKNVFKAISHYERSELTVQVDGVEKTFHNTYFIAIQNGKYFGGGMKIAPKGDPSKETFQVVVAHSLTAAILIGLFPTIYVGLHTKIKSKIACMEGKVIKVTFPSPRYFQADGEVLENVSTMTVSKSVAHEFDPFHKRRFLIEFKAKKA
ncbi:MAG: diacylglycerol kinase family protein [Candidatus Izemoplasmatales bacterium]